jgi:hypothetical protein
MISQGSSPGVQDGLHAGLGAQPLGILTEFLQAGDRTPQQQSIEQLLVAMSQ